VPATLQAHVFPGFLATRGKKIAVEKGPGEALLNRPKSLSGLEKRRDELFHLFERDGALLDLAVYEEGRRRVDLELLLGPLPHPPDAVGPPLLGRPLFDLLLGEAALLDRGEQRPPRLFARPGALGAEQQVDQGVVFVLVAGAARQHEGARRDRIEREFAQDVP